MDKIWYRKSFEVGDHWQLWQNRQKSNAKKKSHLKLHHNNKTQDLFVQTTGFQGIHVTVVLDGQ